MLYRLVTLDRYASLGTQRILTVHLIGKACLRDRLSVGLRS